MSLGPILGEYLAAMRERGELDVLLPELLGAMGHTVLTRPQRGTRQAGVDCLAEAAGPEGPEAFMFVLKHGDVDRGEFYSSPQGIEPSIREVTNDYIRNRLPHHLEQAKKHIVLVSNGRMKEQIAQGFASLTKDVAERDGCDLSFWGGDKLTALIEENLINESLFSGESRAHLRRAIATIDRADIATGYIARFFAGALPQDDAVDEKEFIKRFTAALTGWLVLRSWCRIENNLRPAVLAAEYLLLTVWSNAQRSALHARKGFQDRQDALKGMYVELLGEYYDKVLPQLAHPRSLYRYRPTRMHYSNLLCEEIGRLSTLSLLLQKTQRNESINVLSNLAQLLQLHQGCLLPYFDGQSIDLSLAIAAFMAGRAMQPVSAVTNGCVDRLRAALHYERYLPIDSDSFDDALSVELDEPHEARQFFQHSSLVPMLATVAAEAKQQSILDSIRSNLLPELNGVTLERWFPCADLELSWGKSVRLGDLGVSRVAVIRESCAAEADEAFAIPDGAAEPESLELVKAKRLWLLALSSRAFRHPLPPWYFRLVSADISEPTLKS